MESISAEVEELRGLLSANIKARREELKISQEKLAELAGVSVQMINFIENCRTWVSDKTLIKLARALQAEAFELLVPAGTGAKNSSLFPGLLGSLRQNIKNDIDTRFDNFIRQKGDGKKAE
jgi:transcriptional regulator with XRE-family HTH domain